MAIRESVSIILGSIYEQSGDAIVVPRHSSGTISASTESGLASLDVKYRFETSDYGSIRIEEIKSNSFRYVLYATSASDERNIDVIRRIGIELTKIAGANKLKKIVLPLLGTGAGGLDPFQVSEMLQGVLNQNSFGDSEFVIVVNDPNVFTKISSASSSQRPILHALSTSVNDQRLMGNHQLRNRGLIGFVATNPKQGTTALQGFYLINVEDYFYTTDLSREKFENRYPQELGVLGYVYSKPDTGSIQLNRFFDESTGVHVFVTNPNMPVLASYRDETPNNPIFLMEEGGPDRSPVYFYSNSYDFFFQPLQTKNAVNNDFLPSYTNDSDHNSTEDKLQFTQDIESFATVISLKSVDPPLAIGLFGNWGSGKSFFMEKLRERIKKLISEQQPEDTYVKHVVHVHFNSWHYSDANLWASLITEIFDSLREYADDTKNIDEIDKLSNTLQITSVQKEEVEKKKKELEKSIVKLEVERADKRKKLKDLTGLKFLEILVSNPEVQNDLTVFKTAGIENIIKDREDLNKYIGQINKAKGTVKNYWRIARDTGNWGWRWGLAIAIMAFVFIISYLYSIRRIPLAAEWEKLTFVISGLFSAIVAFVGNAIAIVTPVWIGLKKAATRLKSMEDSFSARPEPISPELEKKKAEISELNNSLADLNKQISDTKQQINDISSGKKLLEFINQQSRNENYSRQLGLISWIRKDFDRLDELLRKQHKMNSNEKEKLINPQGVSLQVDRIILYIDDLDRCNEKIVVNVLEAIHLLLAFPLFVVIVGVDPRWLNNALDEKYKMMFGSKSNGKVNNEHDDFTVSKEIVEDAYTQLVSTKPATSYDYLEKIFQITFSLKPVSVDGRAGLIEYLLKRNTPLANKTISNSTNEERPIDQTEKTQIATQAADDTSQQAKAKTETEKEKESEKRKQLTFSDDEIFYMQKISGLFGHTPRTIGRYVNIYKIIKTHESLKRDKDNSIQDYRTVMYILALMIGYPQYIQSFIQDLRKNDTDFMIKDVFSDWDQKPELKSLHQELLSTFSDTSTADFKKNLELISRFSFRSHAL